MGGYCVGGCVGVIIWVLIVWCLWHTQVHGKRIHCGQNNFVERRNNNHKILLYFIFGPEDEIQEDFENVTSMFNKSILYIVGSLLL